MKTLRNLLSALAFVFAFGAAIAFSIPTETDAVNKEAKRKTSCTLAEVSSDCSLMTSSDPICSIIGEPLVQAVDPSASDCDNATFFRDPN